MKKKKKIHWNKDCGQVKMACWNPWSLSNERLNYCRALNYDILGLTELHNAHNKNRWRGKHWITSEDAEIDDDGKNLDPAAGAVILLSKRFSKKILAQGSVGARIVWVRLDGPVCPLFVVCAYIPQKYRTAAPQAADTIHGFLINCKNIKPTDCVILMGDFNCELERNVQGCRLMNKRPDDGHSTTTCSLLIVSSNPNENAF